MIRLHVSKIHLIIGAALCYASVLFSPSSLAATATLDLTTQKFIGGVSELDREKYFNIHMTSNQNRVTNAELDYLVNELNAGFGRQFWSPFAVHAGNAPYPSAGQAMSAGPGNIASTKAHPNYSYYSKRRIVTDHPSKVFVNGEDPNLGATWAANYFKYYFDDDTRPLFYEPMNEPFVHAGDFGNNQDAIRLRMTNVFKAIGQKFDQEGIDTKVIGYSSAWPSMELWDFNHFNGRMKQFMDIAGPHIDSFSIHPYDGINVVGANSERSGSNLESLLDLLETYSYFKWAEVKPHTISEYGGIESGYGDTYSDLRSAQSLLSQNKMLMQLLNRQDRLLTSVPFNTGKSSWFYNAGNNWNPYGADLLRPDPSSIENGQPTNFFWTKRVDFYRLWSDVRGQRVKVSSDNPDIQVNAFVIQNKAYVAINSLADYNESVSLNFAGSLGEITNVRRKRMIVYRDASPVYTDTIVSAPSSHMFVPGETIVWEYTFANNVVLNGQLSTDHYYAPEHLVPINANQTRSFTLNNVDSGPGDSVIRIGLGRAHGKSLQPTVNINGSVVPVSANWAGGDQATRDSFFGAIEIPFDNVLLNANNNINVTFPDSGGRIASVVLQVNKQDSGGVIDDVEIPQLFSTLPSQASYTFPVNYSASTSREVVVEFWDASGWLASEITTVNTGSGTVNVNVNLSSAPAVGTNGYIVKYAIRPVGTDWMQNIDSEQINNISIEADSDSDGVTDDVDNCRLVSNPEQQDTDQDGFGNRCDGDFNNDLIVNFLDLSEFANNYLSTGDLAADLNGDGVVNLLDLSLFGEMYLQPPGPGATGPIDQQAYTVLSTRTLDADGPEAGDSAYDLIREFGGSNPIEAPDLYPENHPGVEHIVEASDSVVGEHFVFKIHRDIDIDRDRIEITDRQRNEIKTYNNSEEALKAYEDETFVIRWKFRINSDMEVSTRFSHFFQLKAVGGQVSQPVVSITGNERSGEDGIEVRHSPLSDFTVLERQDWSIATGEWIEVYCRAKFSNDGELRLIATRLSDGAVVFDIHETNIDMWRGEAPDHFVRPKWGIYRSIVELDNLRPEEEQVQFANFEVSKVMPTN